MLRRLYSLILCAVSTYAFFGEYWSLIFPEY